MPVRRSDDCAGPSVGTEPLPLRGQRHPRLTKGRPGGVVWAAAGLVVIGAAATVLVTHQPRGQGLPNGAASLGNGTCIQSAP